MVIFLVPLAVLEHLYFKRVKYNGSKVSGINVVSNSSESEESYSGVKWCHTFTPHLPFPLVVHVIYSGVMWAGNLLFWIVGLQYTTTFKASVVANLHPILLVMSLAAGGTAVSCLEWVGVLVSFGGILLISLRERPSHLPPEVVAHDKEWLGLLLCFVSAACEVLVVFNRLKTKRFVPLMQYTAATTVVVALISSLSFLVLESDADSSWAGSIFCRGLESDHCIIGWTSYKWIRKVFLFGFIIGVICFTGFNYALQHIPPLVYSSLTLLDPAVTAALSWLIGVEALPGWLVWLGGLVVMSGVGLISAGGASTPPPMVTAQPGSAAHVDPTAAKSSPWSSLLAVSLLQSWVNRIRSALQVLPGTTPGPDNAVELQALTSAVEDVP